MNKVEKIVEVLDASTLLTVKRGSAVSEMLQYFSEAVMKILKIEKPEAFFMEPHDLAQLTADLLDFSLAFPEMNKVWGSPEGKEVIDKYWKNLISYIPMVKFTHSYFTVRINNMTPGIHKVIVRAEPQYKQSFLTFIQYLPDGMMLDRGEFVMVGKANTPYEVEAMINRFMTEISTAERCFYEEWAIRNEIEI